jgi:hypothetical protein
MKVHFLDFLVIRQIVALTNEESELLIDLVTG